MKDLPSVHGSTSDIRAKLTSNKTTDTEGYQLSARLKGIESESAIDYHTSQASISAAVEKRKKFHQSSPRVFSYDKAEIRKISPKNSADSSAKGSQTVNSPVVTDKTLSNEVIDNAKNHIAERVVSTSYSESLEKIFQNHSVQDRRLSALQEEQSRPTSAATNVSSNIQHPPTGSGFLFDDMNFIQYTSQDLQHYQKKLVAKMIGRYVMGDVLGEGSYGKVKEGYCSETLARVAVKIMKQSKLKKIPGGEANVKREINLLKKIQHKNVVKLMDVILNVEKLKTYVVFEYCATTLQILLSRASNGKIPLSQAQRYFKQIVKGLRYLHSKGIIHRDIKPGNILITVDDTIKISDLGVAEEVGLYVPTDYLSTSAGSPAFQPPEVTSGSFDKFSGSKVDIWAIGVTLFHMISGKYPFDGDSIYTLFDNITKCQYVIPSEADEILSSLISGILTRDPLLRLTIEQIAEHIWMKIEIIKSIDEVPVIDFVDLSTSSKSNLSGDALGTVLDERLVPVAISNPNFAYDTTLIPYIETLYEDVPTNLRRSSITERIKYEKRIEAKKGKSAIAEKFLRRLSKPIIIQPNSPNSPEEDIQDPRKRQPSNASSITSQKSSRSTKLSFRSDSEKSCKVQ